jgi:hypothetical protein
MGLLLGVSVLLLGLTLALLLAPFSMGRPVARKISSLQSWPVPGATVIG